MRRSDTCVGRLMRDVQPELGDSLIQASKDGDNERLQSLAGEEIWVGVEDKGVGENETHEDGKYSLVPSQEEIVHLICYQKTASQALETFQWASEISNFCASLPPDDDQFISVIRGFCHARKGRNVVRILDWVREFGRQPSLKVVQCSA